MPSKSTSRRLISYAMVYKFRIIGALLILCVAVGAELCGPFITKMIIDEYLKEGATELSPILGLLGIYLLLLVVGSISTFTQSYMLQSTALQIIKNMRMDLMSHIQRISLRYFDSTPIGQVVSRIANDTEAVRDLFMSFMATFVVSFVHLIGIYTALFLLDTRLALLCLILLPIFALIMKIHLKYSKIYITIMRARLSDMNAKINESIVVMPIIQAFRREKKTIDEFEELNDDRYVNQLKQFRVYSLSSRNIVGTIGSLVMAMVIWYFGRDALQATISFGVFYAFGDYVGRIFQPIIGIFDQMTNAQRAFVSAEKVFAIMDIEGNEVEKTDQVKRPEGVVKFDNVSFAYKEGENVLKNINIEARKGETIALVGHTGSGKSSIMNLLLGFYEPGEGQISIDDRDITTYSKQALRKHMGIVLQDPFLFAGDIKFNVSLYNSDITIDRVKKALQDVGAAPFIEQLPNGYDEPVVERGSTLSSGQRQLISFARALAFDPSILILDEATASIDSETESLIQQALKVVSEGRTTFIIAHRLSTIREADQILVLHRGEIVERGNHDELMALEGRYYKMYQLQKGGEKKPAVVGGVVKA
ncbi:ABC transporter ATP-binding protein/permease [Paenibacillus sp. N1-5-1-14]|uniref:ABC transporter ATP-binding protein n=1 Tax=Paenibacillus radicibacter TaxID=2972488 RepID=UPI002158C312|nr:ABC transporter ATP-binding protein [Paenibacillus radicibacter]MCR8642822.1 ABC transporter ATP-binding protein/permease [Paenibacillus radicibacter]